jgi:hypothetical protein
MPDPVQGQEPQGGEDTGGLFDSYLQAVPEDARETVASYLKDAEKNVNSRLSEAAELQKSFGAYKDVDLSGYDPEDLSQLIAWHQQVTSSDEAYRTWLTEQAQEAGLTPAQEQELAQAEEQGELTREEVQDLIQKTAEERLSPVQEQLSNLEAEKAIDFEAQAIDQAFGAIQSEFKLELSKDQKAVILDLGMPLAVDAKGNELPMGDSSWVRKGFDRWKEITDTGNRTFVEQKAQMPSGSLTAGGTAALKPITSYEDANAAMRERLRQANQ